MLVPLNFRNEKGYPFKRDGANVLWAESAGQSCILHFESGEVLAWGYPLSDFHKKVYFLNLFRRLGKFLLVKIKKVINQKWKLALLENGIELPLTPAAYKRLKDYRKKHPDF